jgi:hypothetical protein
MPYRVNDLHHRVNRATFRPRCGTRPPNRFRQGQRGFCCVFKEGRRVTQRHSALIGGLVGFVAGLGACGATDNRPPGIAVVLLAGAVCSLPGFAVGFFLGKKQP